MLELSCAIFVLLECTNQPQAKTMLLSGVQSAYHETFPDLLLELPEVGMVPMSKDTLSSAISVNVGETFQEILGFGGAFTEASALSWSNLSSSDQGRALHLFFGDPSEGGNGYTMGRVPIGSTDFSPASYNFDDVSGDLDMSHFDYDAMHDEAAGILPMIRAAQEIVRHRGFDLKLVASPWSPPAWMKLPVDGNRSMLGSAKPNGLDPRFQHAYALYFSAWLDTYKHHGVDVWAVTIQNEPENPADWEGCLYTPEFMSSFIREHLGPVLRATHPDVKIFGYDHNKDHVVEWAEVLYGDSAVHSFMDGVAVHWYGGLNQDHLNTTHWLAPEKQILATESCQCDHVIYSNDPNETILKWWQRAEELALDCISDLQFWVNGYIVWNLMVNTQGGPNHEHNWCDADLISDPLEENGLGTVIQQGSYYLAGHFSRFIPSGSRRIALDSTVDTVLPPVGQSDIKYGYVILEKCREDADSMAVQSWRVASSEVELEYSLRVLDLCFAIENNRVSDGTVFRIAECTPLKPPKGWAGRYTFIPVNGTDSGYKIYNPHSGKCVTALITRGSDIEMDRGVRILLVELFACLPGDAVNQTFHFRSFSEGQDCFDLNTTCRITTRVGASDGEERCMQSRLVRRPLFSAAAFQAPDGDVSVVALNVGEKALNYTLYDVASGSGVALHLPKRAIATYKYRPSQLSAGESQSDFKSQSAVKSHSAQSAACSFTSLLFLLSAVLGFGLSYHLAGGRRFRACRELFIQCPRQGLLTYPVDVDVWDTDGIRYVAA